jgi:hypothetical protein
MSESLLPKRFLFRFSTPCLYQEELWTAKGARLDGKYRLVSFAELEGQPLWADVRAAWSESGLAFALHVRGKKQPPWCRTTRPEDCDGLHVWIDTRDVHNVHRASRFCHRFLFMPAGGGRRLDHPQAIPPDRLKVRNEERIDGYLLEAYVPGDALTGFDPAEHPRLGFTYAVLDRELGEQTLAVGSPMPYQEDPSLWATLELVRDER